MEVPGSGRLLEGVIIGRFGNGEQVFHKIGSVARLPITQSLVLFLGRHRNGKLAVPGHLPGVPRPELYPPRP